MKIALIFFVIFFLGCAKIPDVPICVELNNGTGYCAWTISQEEQNVDNNTKLLDGKSWSQVKASGLIVPDSSWAKIKEYILAQCKKNQDCSDKLGSWDRQ